jgi:hypothetical protein
LAEIDAVSVKTAADVRLAIWDKKPGDRVRVKVRRRHDLWRMIDRDFEVQLTAPGTAAGNPS